MKRIVLPIVLIFVAIASIDGQVNLNLENWRISDRAAPFDWSEPENWTSTNGLTEFINPGVNETSDAHEGNSAVLISSLQIFGSNTASSLVLGKGMIDFKTQTISLDGAGLPLEQRLASVSAWYKYENNQNVGAGKAEIFVIRWTPNENKRTVLAYENVSLPISKEYKQIEISLDMDDFIAQMDSVIIIFHSDENADISQGTGKLYIDDVRLGYVTNTDNISVQQSFKISPNPVFKNGSITIDGIDFEAKTIRLYDMNGKILLTEFTQTNTIKLDPSVKSGLYILEITTDRGLYKSKIVIL
ncbi:MAG: T9SS type A sorting domain-containing protein [Saprospiraceae bacterium]|nr:T9SS type A sorting domain-containing protein [Saprospiraceae bacterium]